MKKDVLIAFVLVFFILSLSRCDIKESNNPKLYGLELVDTSNFKKSFLKELTNYVKRDKKCNVFLLKSTMIFRYENHSCNNFNLGGRAVYNEIFVVERAGSYSIGEGEFVFSRIYPSQYFTIGNKTILIASGQDALQNQNHLKEIYHRLIKKDFLNAQKHYMLIFDDVDSVEIVTEICMDLTGTTTVHATMMLHWVDGCAWIRSQRNTMMSVRMRIAEIIL